MRVSRTQSRGQHPRVGDAGGVYLIRVCIKLSLRWCDRASQMNWLSGLGRSGPVDAGEVDEEICARRKKRRKRQHAAHRIPAAPQYRLLWAIQIMNMVFACSLVVSK